MSGLSEVLRWSMMGIFATGNETMHKIRACPWLTLTAAALTLALSSQSIASPMAAGAVVGMAQSGALLAYVPDAGQCTRLFRQWRRGYDDDAKMDVCTDLMGINKYCADHDSFVAVGYDRDQTYRYLVCAPRSHPDSIDEQFVHLAKGIGEGVADAFVAAVPFVGPVLSGVACMYGQIYACAVLALEISDAAGVPVTGVAGEAMGIAADVPRCSDGDLVVCAKIGMRGAKAAGLVIPGKDAAQVAGDAKLCDDGDFAACMRLGQAAADAGGVPRGLGRGSFIDAQDCLAGDTNACTVLGKEAAAAQAPMGGVPDGGAALQACSGGDAASCTRLGKSLATLSGPARGIALGRVQSPTPANPPGRIGNEPMICARARDARRRDSPVAPDLTAQCNAVGGDFFQRTTVKQAPAASPLPQQAARSKMVIAPDPPICVRARDARARNSPIAAALEAQCRAAGGTP